MLIDIPPEIGNRLNLKAQDAGVSVAEYVDRLIAEEESRAKALVVFHEEITRRTASLDAGELVEGEEVMARLIAELDTPAGR